MSKISGQLLLISGQFQDICDISEISGQPGALMYEDCIQITQYYQSGPWWIFFRKRAPSPYQSVVGLGKRFKIPQQGLRQRLPNRKHISGHEKRPEKWEKACS